MPSPTITIGSRTFRKNSEVDRYQIPLDELGDFRMSQIPPHSHVEILGLPEPAGASEMECYGLNGGDEGNHEYLSVYGGASFYVSAEERERTIARLRRAFPYSDADDGGLFRNPNITANSVDDQVLVHLFLSRNFNDRPHTPLREAIAPFVDGYLRLNRASVHVFICHASEDKAAARALASAMKRLGADVWFDEWEIRVGESIVQKVGHALGAVSHLIVLLSNSSVAKPWVQKELSSALMLQLSRRSIAVLPVRLDDCAIPPILADIKYADARLAFEHAVEQIQQSLFSDAQTNAPNLATQRTVPRSDA